MNYNQYLEYACGELDEMITIGGVKRQYFTLVNRYDKSTSSLEQKRIMRIELGNYASKLINKMFDNQSED